MSPDEPAALEDVNPLLGCETFDICLYDDTFWPNAPTAVRVYRLRGYQVLQKWLSNRKRSTIGRPMKPETVQDFAYLYSATNPEHFLDH